MLPLFDHLEAESPRLPLPVQVALDQGATIVTANARAARALQIAYAEDQRTASNGAWAAPHILDWSSWIAELEQHHALLVPDAPMPLTDLQEQQLWSRVQGADRDRVVAPRRMAQLAQGAYGLLGAYRAHGLRQQAAAEPFGQAHEDAERFLVWAAAFDRICQAERWQSRTRLEMALASAVHLLPAQPHLYLVGFDRKTPAQTALLEAFSQAGSVVEEPPLPGPAAPAKEALRFVRATARRQELEACASWCRGKLAAAGSRPPRIGIIAGEVRQVRAELDRVFRRVLMPETTLWTSNSSADPRLPYEFSLGAPLASYPVVRAALLVLAWLRTPLASSEVTFLLTSGFLATTLEEHAVLPMLDAAMRRTRSNSSVSASPLVSLGSMLGRGVARHMPPALRMRLERLQARIAREEGGTREPRRRSFAAWAELVPALLAEAGWPGFDPADSLTWQAQQRWTRLLGEVALLGFDGSQATWGEFQAALRAEAEPVIFAPESTDAPIQILGAFESSGQSFDALWFLGADDAHWPAVGRPHPLLPVSLQRKAAMPHATPEADWLLGKQATERILASAPEVVVSYAAQEKGLEQRPSPLLAAVAPGISWRAPDEVARQQPGSSAQAFEPERGDLLPVALELVDDSEASPWSGQAAGGVAGGAEVLKRQAACAFQSFAATRLHAAPLEEPGSGLDARQRGTLLHTVLERLWTTEPVPAGLLRLHSREDLEHASRDGSLPALVAHHVDAALAPKLAESGSDPWVTAYLHAERERLMERLLAWLSCERERQPFAVRQLEAPLNELAVGPLRLSVRPDRIDALADGTHLLLDYKTGKITSGAWEGDRPEEPQLPLYALFGGVEQVSAVAFAQIRADGTALMARAEKPAAQVSPSLGATSDKNRFDDEIRDNWREALLRLANEFAGGYAAVNPRDGSRTCKWCSLPGLCRVQELGGARNTEDESEGALHG